MIQTMSDCAEKYYGEYTTLNLQLGERQALPAPGVGAFSSVTGTRAWIDS